MHVNVSDTDKILDIIISLSTGIVCLWKIMVLMRHKEIAYISLMIEYGKCHGISQSLNVHMNEPKNETN